MKEIAPQVMQEASKYGLSVLVLVIVLGLSLYAVAALWKANNSMQKELLEVIKENSLALQENAQSNKEKAAAYSALERTIQLLMSKMD